MRLLKLAPILFTTTVEALPIPASQSLKDKYGRLVVFGDSFSDDGNGSWDASNHTWPADPAYYNHSFSNGPVWAITLANALEAQLLDYAAGGATADNSIVAGFTGPTSEIPVPSAYDQLNQFLSKDSPRPNDVFVRYIGANDPLFNPNISGSAIASLISRDVDLLYRSGAKHILLANYPPISSFPATYTSPLYQQIGPPYSDALNRGLSEIAAAWSAYIDIRVVEVEGLFQDILVDPAAYDIDEKYVRPPTPCLNGTYGTGTRSLCTDPEKYLFFDAYHPVSRVHDRIAGLFEQTLRASKI